MLAFAPMPPVSHAICTGRPAIVANAIALGMTTAAAIKPAVTSSRSHRAG